MVQRTSHQMHWWHAAIAWASIVARHSRVIHVARGKSECCVCMCVCVGGGLQCYVSDKMTVILFLLQKKLQPIYSYMGPTAS